MKKRNINIGRKNPSSAEINSHKDFAGLQQQLASSASGVSAAPALSKPAWLAIGTAVVTAVIVAGTFIFKGKKKKEQKQTQLTGLSTEMDTVNNELNAPFINPLSEKTNIPFETYALNAQTEQVLEYPTGTKINIPSNAFLNSQGELVKGEVVIKYREFHNQLDILKAGIPMHYDSAGSTHLESAGMMEIRAYQNDKPLFCNPEKEIKVDLASYQKEGDYNVYFLNEEEKEWRYKGKDKREQPKSEQQANNAQATKESQTGQSKAAAETNTLQPEKPKPLAVKNVNFNSHLWEARNAQGIPITGEVYYFTIEDIIPVQSEMAAFKGLTWKYKRGDQEFRSKFFEDCLGFITKPGDHLYRYWDMVLVTYDPGKEYLTFTFRRKGKSDSRANLRPIFPPGADEFTCGQLFARYKALLENKKQQQRNNAKNMRHKINEKLFTWYYVQRSFRIDGFGIWNCDTPFDVGDRFEHCTTELAYNTNDSETGKITAVYFIEQSINSVVELPKSRGKLRGYYQPNGNGYVVALFYNGAIGYCNLNEKATLDLENKQMTCPLTVHNDVIKGVDELREMMFKTEEKQPI